MGESIGGVFLTGILAVQCTSLVWAKSAVYCDRNKSIINFPCASEKLHHALSQFLSLHPTIRVRVRWDDNSGSEVCHLSPQVNGHWIVGRIILEPSPRAQRSRGGWVGKIKTTKLDKINRSVSYLSQSRIGEGLEVSADEPPPIHLRRCVMKSFEDPIDCDEGDCRLMDWRRGRVDRRYLFH